MNNTVKIEMDGELAIVTIDNPPVNALGRPVREGLLAAFSALHGQPGVKAVVLCCAGRTFVAGADIAEFTTGDFTTPDFNDVLASVENLGVPVLAAIHGTALGGGFELTLSCHYRIASRSAKLGLPEVTLGILPGAGGTQRLPRLVGPAVALDMILSGRPIGADKAHTLGIVDVLADGDLLVEAKAYAQQLVATQAGPRRTRERVVDVSAIDAGFFEKSRAEVAVNYKGAYAPPRIVDCVEAASNLSFAEGLKVENKRFFECLESPQARALQHVFFAERNAAKIPGLDKDLALRPVKTVAVIGAGTMGGGIAMCFANAGIPVTLLEASQEALDRGLGLVRKNYEITAAKGKLSPEKLQKLLGLIQGTVDYAGIKDCDLVIEAVFENLDVKKQVMARLGATMKPGAILATNTSTLDVDLLAEASGRPADVVGMHFFSPANVMRLLEVVRGARTGGDVLATVMTLARKIGKVAVVSGVCYGFIGNRMLEGYLREAEFLLLEGASPTQVDQAIESMGMAMGPCRMMDMAGVDVIAKIAVELEKEGRLPADPAYRAVVRKLADLGRYGQKTSAGFYRYDGRQPQADPELETVMASLAAGLGIQRRQDIGQEEIIERCLYPLINEGARILEEGIAYRAGDIDIVWTSGYGFPTLRGGPMHMAGEIGLDRVLQSIESYGRKLGNAHGYWTPASLLASLAGTKKTFSEQG